MIERYRDISVEQREAEPDLRRRYAELGVANVIYWVKVVEYIQTGFWDKEVRKRAKRPQLKQAELFSSREVAQFGVNPRPTIPLEEFTMMQLKIQDTRTEEEKQREEVETNAAGELFSSQSDENTPQ